MICKEPDTTIFVPQRVSNCELLTMTVDEYESIRLIDLEGFSQEECANKLGVARTTAQLIYKNAREKLAQVLVMGMGLRIEGGNFMLCDGSLGCKRCHLNNSLHGHRVLNEKENGIMRVAVTYDNGQIFQHFGRTENFKVYDVEGNEIISSEIVSSNGQGHGALAGVLSVNQIDVLICGGIGGGAQTALSEAGIELCAGATGDADQAVREYLAGNLVNSGSNCNHHHHEEGASCGNHGCGSHGCR
ncbi:MAG: NifB/NifX family molybdenum-iron cluster-binding protein [Lachnospiraceae bacterium]